MKGEGNSLAAVLRAVVEIEDVALSTRRRVRQLLPTRWQGEGGGLRRSTGHMRWCGVKAQHFSQQGTCGRGRMGENVFLEVFGGKSGQSVAQQIEKVGYRSQSLKLLYL